MVDLIQLAHTKDTGIAYDSLGTNIRNSYAGSLGSALVPSVRCYDDFEVVMMNSKGFQSFVRYSDFCPVYAGHSVVCRW